MVLVFVSRRNWLVTKYMGCSHEVKRSESQESWTRREAVLQAHPYRKSVPGRHSTWHIIAHSKFQYDRCKLSTLSSSRLSTRRFPSWKCQGNQRDKADHLAREVRARPRPECTAVSKHLAFITPKGGGTGSLDHERMLRSWPLRM